jgi:hypothetical protein
MMIKKIFVIVMLSMAITGCAKNSVAETEAVTETEFAPVTETETETETEAVTETESAPVTETETETETESAPVAETETETETEAVTETESAPVTETETEAVTETEPETEPVDYFVNSRHGAEPLYEEWVFVGDSRTNGMGDFCGPMTWLARDGCGKPFLDENEDEIFSWEGKNIVFNLGVNDLYRLNQYIDWYWNTPVEWREKNHVILMSVNPCNRGDAYLNPQIEWFNENLLVNLPEGFTWCDSYSWLMYSQGYDTTDGTHYTGSSYQDIYWFVTQF